ETSSVLTAHHGPCSKTQYPLAFGWLRTFRVKDFIAAGGATVPPISTTTVSWRPGVNVGLPIGTTYTLLTDRPEAIPRKVQIALIDDTDEYATRAELDAALSVSGGTPNVRAKVTGTPAIDGDFNVYALKISAAPDNPY